MEIRDGVAAFSCTDRAHELITAFKAACRRNNVRFVDMTDALTRTFRETGEFPKGFSTTVPWKGHLNETGHRLVAQAIFDALFSQDTSQ